MTLGVVAYDVNIELAKVPAMVLSFAVGSATFATLGVALAGAARSAQAASALANATILPMAFISNIFIIFQGEATECVVYVQCITKIGETLRSH